jgi:hypothetical protein
MKILQNFEKKRKVITSDNHWNINEENILALKIENNGGTHINVLGSKTSLEYLFGVLADKNIPHRRKKRHIEIIEASHEKLKNILGKTSLPFQFILEC